MLEKVTNDLDRQVDEMTKRAEALGRFRKVWEAIHLIIDKIVSGDPVEQEIDRFYYSNEGYLVWIDSKTPEFNLTVKVSIEEMTEKVGIVVSRYGRVTVEVAKETPFRDDYKFTTGVSAWNTIQRDVVLNAGLNWIDLESSTMNFEAALLQAVDFVRNAPFPQV